MEFKNLYKSFDDKVIFENSSFKFPDNQITFILGESGRGKTTLLRILAGLDLNYKGEIDGMPEKISYVFQEPRLFGSLTALENVKIVSENSEESAKELLSLLELNDALNKKPDELSGGMKMRVNLARALNYNADLYLMDEPFSALDDETKKRILPNVFTFLNGKTVFFVSHNTEEAYKYADKIFKID